MQVCAVALLSLVLSGCSVGSGSGLPEGGDAVTMVFSDANACTAITGRSACSQVMCDVVPEGQSVEETCGTYFQEGIAANGLDDEGIRQFVEQAAEECWTVEQVGDRVVDIRTPDDEIASVSGPDDWLDEVVATVGSNCDASL